MGYTALKHSHAGLAYLTILFFVLRFALFYVSPKLKSNIVFKVLPHVIDTLLLVFAIMLLINGSLSVAQPWLMAKIIGLFLYIAFGVVALRKANKTAFVGAVVTFAYVLGVAKKKSILSWLELL